MSTVTTTQSTEQTECADGNENNCVVCFRNLEIYSIGPCDHPVCHECSVRMRVLCSQNECPICRGEMPQVIFTKEVTAFKKIKLKDSGIRVNERYGIYFMSEAIELAFNKLLEHRCKLCEDQVVRNFNDLSTHMKRSHALFYCDLCVNNLKIFSYERRCYTRKELGMHRRTGDEDDRSHRGHPLCEFCDERYMDNDELYRHVRRDHFYCHFCDTDGIHQYYPTYETLRQHFQSDHFLCEEGDCKAERFTSVFRTDIDLKAHKATEHSRYMNKHQAKQARTLEIDFRLAPRNSRVPSVRLGHHLTGLINGIEDDGATGYNSPSLQDVIAVNEQIEESIRQQRQINAMDPELFPSLQGNGVAVPASTLTTLQRSSKPGTVSSTFRGGGGSRTGLAKTNENFPALSGVTEVSVSVSTNQPCSTKTTATMATYSNKVPNVYIKVNHVDSSQNSAGPSTESSSRAPKMANSFSGINKSAFPTLGSSQVVGAPKWVASKPKEVKKEPRIETTNNVKTERLRLVISDNPQDFPSLGKGKLKTNQSSSFFPPPEPKLKSNAKDLDRKPGSSSSISSNTNNAKKAKTDDNANKKKVVEETITNGTVDSDRGKGKEKMKQQNRINNETSKNQEKDINTKKAKEMKKNDVQNVDRSDKGAKSNESKKNGVNKPVESKQKQNKTSSSKSVITPDNKESNKLVNSDSSNSKNINKENKKNNNQNDNEKKQEKVNKDKSNKNSEKITKTEVPGKSDKKIQSKTNPKQQETTGKNPGKISGKTSSQASRETSQSSRDIETNAPPPGFDKMKVKPPPPGFVKPAPPGFSAGSMMKRIQDMQRVQDFTFTTSTGAQFPIYPTLNNYMTATDTSNGKYFNPPNFHERNQALIESFAKLIKPEDMSELKQLSQLFKEGAYSAENYYKYCKRALKRDFDRVFPEMLALLPDVNRQHELYSEYINDVRTNKSLEMCYTCQQIIKSDDAKLHKSNHTLDSHFPSLSATSRTPWKQDLK